MLVHQRVYWLANRLTHNGVRKSHWIVYPKKIINPPSVINCNPSEIPIKSQQNHESTGVKSHKIP